MMGSEHAHRSGLSRYSKSSKQGVEDPTGFELYTCNTSGRDGEKFKWSCLLVRFGPYLISLMNHWGILYNTAPIIK